MVDSPREARPDAPAGTEPWVVYRSGNVAMTTTVASVATVALAVLLIVLAVSHDPVVAAGIIGGVLCLVAWVLAWIAWQETVAVSGRTVAYRGMFGWKAPVDLDRVLEVSATGNRGARYFRLLVDGAKPGDPPAREDPRARTRRVWLPQETGNPVVDGRVAAVLLGRDDLALSRQVRRRMAELAGRQGATAPARTGLLPPAPFPPAGRRRSAG